MSGDGPTIPDIEREYQRLNREAEDGGYHLNPDTDFTKNLVRGLIINTRRYGYPACPCRLGVGIRNEDLDIICPCDYRDPDLNEYGACYCALYVSGKVMSGEQQAGPIPERRPARDERLQFAQSPVLREKGTGLAYPVWRCRVCGYLCARETPPLVCPVCKAQQDRFERFL
jgi:ferredoxin-thioredoxin reductase catalytic chain